MREKFRQFMIGRYGTDALNQALSISSIVLFLLSWITRWAPLGWAAFALLGWCYYRTFSRDIARRTEENYKFYTFCASHNWSGKLKARLALYQEMWANRKTHRYYSCPQCHRRLRVPKGRGRIEICCPRCGTRFIRKS